MKAMALAGAILLSGCANTYTAPAPIHQLNIEWKVEESKVSLSFSDYNKLGLWMMDVNRYIQEQQNIIKGL